MKNLLQLASGFLFTSRVLKNKNTFIIYVILHFETLTREVKTFKKYLDWTTRFGKKINNLEDEEKNLLLT